MHLRCTAIAACMTLSLMLGQLEARAQQAGDATTYTQQTFYDWFNKYKEIGRAHV